MFDFDGVLVESAKIKTDAFRELFAAHPQAVEEIVALHEREAGRSRFWKFDTIYADILRLPLHEAERERLGREFSGLVMDKILTCPLVHGAGEFLESCGLPMFVVSGTPQDELREILERRGLSRFFRGIYGSPRRKGEILTAILAELGISGRQALMVGDAREDLLGAREAGTFFLGRVAPGEPSPFRACRSLPDLVDLQSEVERFSRMVPVSVAVCSYNGLSKGFLGQALQSVREQTVLAEELLLVDDGSRDGTADYVEKFFPEFRVLRQPNGGLAQARNTALRETSAPYLCYLDDDDAWHPDKLARQWGEMEGRPELGVLYTSLRQIDAEGRPQAKKRAADGTRWPDILLANVVLGPSSVMLRRTVAQRVGLFQPGLGGAEDYDFWIRASREAELRGLPEVLTDYRVHRGQMSSGYAAMAEQALGIVLRHSERLGSRQRRRVMAYNASGVLFFGLLLRRSGATSLGLRWLLRFPALEAPLLRLVTMLISHWPSWQHRWRAWVARRLLR